MCAEVRGIRFLELESQAVVSHVTWVLGTKALLQEQIQQALKCRAISLACLPCLPKDAEHQPLSWLPTTRGKKWSLPKDLNYETSADSDTHPPKHLTYLLTPKGKEYTNHCMLVVPFCTLKAQALDSHNTHPLVIYFSYTKDGWPSPSVSNL